MSNPAARLLMLDLADHYKRMAERALERAKSRGQYPQ
jgi:hypothetical protein